MYSRRTFKKGLQGTRPWAKNEIPDCTVAKGIFIMPSSHSLKHARFGGLGTELADPDFLIRGVAMQKRTCASFVASLVRVLLG